jgi:small subunit ribosomal protein S9
MLPKSKMGRQMATKLKVYKGPHHPHQAQQPQPLDAQALDQSCLRARLQPCREVLIHCGALAPEVNFKEQHGRLVQYYGTGRRKSSIARVFLRPGSGKFSVNKKECDVYFVTAQQRAAARAPSHPPTSAETFDVITTVKGGGVMGQADAVKLGIARALMVFNPELRKALKAEGLVTRDSRGKERKKYGQKGARARFQFSKR